MSGMDLVAFLTARLDELARVGEQGANPPWPYDEVPVSVLDDEYRLKVDPAWLLADVAAKRRILADYRKLASAPGSIGADLTDGARRSELENVTQLLAMPYADHPDYREEWRP